MNVIYLKNAPFKHSVTAKDLEGFKTVLAERPQLLSDAQAAEKAGDFEKAFTLFSKANQKEGKQRSAFSFAKELEKNDEIYLRSDEESFRMEIINYLYDIYLNE